MICWRKEIKLTVFLLSAQPSRMQWELHQDANHQCTTQQFVSHHPWPKVYLVFRPENVTRFVFKQQFNLTLLKLFKMKVMNDLLWRYTTIFLWKYTTIFYENIQSLFCVSLFWLAENFPFHAISIPNLSKHCVTWLQKPVWEKNWENLGDYVVKNRAVNPNR